MLQDYNKSKKVFQERNDINGECKIVKLQKSKPTPPSLRRPIVRAISPIHFRDFKLERTLHPILRVVDLERHNLHITWALLQRFCKAWSTTTRPLVAFKVFQLATEEFFDLGLCLLQKRWSTWDVCGCGLFNGKLTKWMMVTVLLGLLSGVGWISVPLPEKIASNSACSHTSSILMVLGDPWNLTLSDLHSFFNLCVNNGQPEEEGI